MAAFVHIRVAFAAQSRHSSGNGFRSAASYRISVHLIRSRIQMAGLTLAPEGSGLLVKLH